jgi:hypothetical protein
MKKMLLFAANLFILFSCSNEDVTDVNNQNSQTLIKGYKIDSKTTYTDPSNPTFQQIVTGNLLNGKLFSITTQNILGGVVQPSETTQQYFYTNELVTSTIINGNTRQFYYDNQSRVIGAKLFYSGSAEALNYRFVYQSDNVVYFEKTSNSYDDLNTQINQRIVVKLDANDNIVEAGIDNNLDGIPESQNKFRGISV